MRARGPGLRKYIILALIEAGCPIGFVETPKMASRDLMESEVEGMEELIFNSYRPFDTDQIVWEWRIKHY